MVHLCKRKAVSVGNFFLFLTVDKPYSCSAAHPPQKETISHPNPCPTSLFFSLSLFALLFALSIASSLHPVCIHPSFHSSSFPPVYRHSSSYSRTHCRSASQRDTLQPPTLSLTLLIGLTHSSLSDDAENKNNCCKNKTRNSSDGTAIFTLYPFFNSRPWKTYTSNVRLCCRCRRPPPPTFSVPTAPQRETTGEYHPLPNASLVIRAGQGCSRIRNITPNLTKAAGCRRWTPGWRFRGATPGAQLVQR